MIWQQLEVPASGTKITNLKWKFVFGTNIQYSILTLPPEKSSDPGGKTKAPKVEWNTKPGIL